MDFRRLAQVPKWRGALIGLACALACWLLGRSEMMQWLEHWAADTCFVVRGERPSTTKIVIVGIDDQWLPQLGKPLTFISPELAKVVTYVELQGATAIGIDVFVPDSSAALPYYRAGEPGDADTVGRAVAETGIVTLPEWLLPGGQWLRPLYQWQTKQDIHPEWNDLGFVNLTVDSDTFIRRQALGAKGTDGSAHPCLGLAVLARAQGLSAQWFAAPELRLGDGVVPCDAAGAVEVNYVGPPGTIPTVPFANVLDAAQDKAPLDFDWRGAIVLIGMVGASQQDRHTTPFSNQSLMNLSGLVDRDRAERMAGVEVHANIVATLGDRAFITTPWWLSTPLLLAIFGAGLGSALIRLSLGWGTLLAVAHHFVWKTICLAAFAWGNWRIEATSMLLLGILVYGAVFALRWRWMRQMMGMFKSEAVARAIEGDPSKINLQGEEREVTVLFSDIRNFTTFSEHHTPQEVVRLLNEYFSAVVPLIEIHGGTVNQYIGDGLMVIFGAPASLEQHAYQAVQAAIATLRRVHAQSSEWRALGADDFRIGVGIHTGKVVAGTVGSPRRLDYTAIGDTVNTAARIESANKELESELLISQATFESLTKTQRDELRLLGEPRHVDLKGKKGKMLVYAIDVSDQDGLPVQPRGFAATETAPTMPGA